MKTHDTYLNQFKSNSWAHTKDTAQSEQRNYLKFCSDRNHIRNTSLKISKKNTSRKDKCKQLTYWDEREVFDPIELV
jgi:hypothetical protein